MRLIESARVEILGNKNDTQVFKTFLDDDGCEFYIVESVREKKIILARAAPGLTVMGKCSQFISEKEKDNFRIFKSFSEALVSYKSWKERQKCTLPQCL